jgi:serine/threonine protein kinase
MEGTRNKELQFDYREYL